MKQFCVILISAAALMAQDTPAAAPKAADGSHPMMIPAGATRGADGDMHYTDAEGKKWIYRMVPFGVVRLDEKSEAQTKVLEAEKAAGIKAFEKGDKVRFERKGPFGVWKWEKKKSDLDESEKAALENARATATTSKQE
jgi:hypothetical protein